MADTVLAGVTDFVKRIIRRLPLYRLYPGKVVSQSAVGSPVDFLPDDAAELGQTGFSGIPLSLGLPGFRVKAQGARLHLFFGGAKPSRQRCALYDQSSPVDEISFDGGTKAVARVDDTVDCGTISGVAPGGGGPVTFTYTPPDGTPPVVGVSIALIGLIDSGCQKFKA